MKHPIHSATIIIIATLVLATLINLLMEHTKIFLWSIAILFFIAAILALIEYNKGKL